jgi:hypothetical protein
MHTHNYLARNVHCLQPPPQNNVVHAVLFSNFAKGDLRKAWNFGPRDEEKERRLLERGQHMCRRVTSALQREMSIGLTSSSSSSADLDFVSASAPVIVYSLEAHVLDVPTRRKLAFKYALRCASFVLVTSNFSRQVWGSRFVFFCVCDVAYTFVLTC